MPTPRIQSMPTKKYPKLWLSTPTLDGRVTTEYMHAYDKLKSALFQQKINSQADFLIGNSILPAGRNLLVDRFLQSDADWILMVDSDISYQPEDILACLPHLSNAIIGLPCCKKFAKWDRVATTIRSNPDYAAADIPAILADANFAIPENGLLKSDENGLANVAWIGTGAMLTSREALMKIISKNPDSKVEVDGEARQEFFKYEVQTVHKKGTDLLQYAGEDVSFCMLAQRSGVEVKAKIDAKTGHAGFFNYRFDAGAVNRLRSPQDRINDEAAAPKRDSISG